MQNNTQPQHDKISAILEKIKKQELDPHSRTYFRLQFFALIVMVLALVMVSVFFASFLAFTFRASGHGTLLDMGLSGTQIFLLLFPAKLLFLEIILIFLVEYFLRTFKFGYRVPVLYLFVGVVGIVVISGFVVDRSALHEVMLDKADQEILPPPLRGFYESVRRPPSASHGVFKGIIAGISSSTMNVELDNPMGIGTSTPVVVLLPQAGYIQQLPPIQFRTGDRIVISGELVNGQIRARTIRNIKDMGPLSPNKKHKSEFEQKMK